MNYNVKTPYDNNIPVKSNNRITFKLNSEIK